MGWILAALETWWRVVERFEEGVMDGTQKDGSWDFEASAWELLWKG